MNNSNIQVLGKGYDAKHGVRLREEVRLLTVRQAAKYLGTTVSTLYSKVWRREIPFIKLGRSVRFDLVDLDKLIEQSKVKPFEPLEPSVQFRR
jgi:excisionase family DNA binding protein